MHDQITFCAFHSFLVVALMKHNNYEPCMHNNNLEVRIVGSSCCLLLPVLLFLFFKVNGPK